MDSNPRFNIEITLHNKSTKRIAQGIRFQVVQSIVENLPWADLKEFKIIYNSDVEKI